MTVILCDLLMLLNAFHKSISRQLSDPFSFYCYIFDEICLLSLQMIKKLMYITQNIKTSLCHTVCYPELKSWIFHIESCWVRNNFWSGKIRCVSATKTINTWFLIISLSEIISIIKSLIMINICYLQSWFAHWQVVGGEFYLGYQTHTKSWCCWLIYRVYHKKSNANSALSLKPFENNYACSMQLYTK